MMHWDTGDRVVDSIFRQLEGLSSWRDDADPEQVHQLLCAVIEIKEMLPQAVARHFKFPYLGVGDAHFRNGDDYRRNLVASITKALKAGLDNASIDPLLKRDGGADLGDRPRSRGEEILDAADVFEAEGTVSALAKLQLATSPTRLQSRVKKIALLMSRKRPYGNQEPRVAMLGELHRLRFEAEGYHSQKA